MCIRDSSLTDELQKKLLNGAYKMYVFSEQDNGTNFTDFAGELIPLTFIEVSSYSISFLPGDHGTLTGETVLTVPEGNTLQDDGGVIPTVTPFCDYTFTYWLGSDNQKYSHEELLRLPIISDMAFTAQYRYIGDSSENEEKYTVIYTDGVSDEEIFPDQVTENLLFGTNTPVFDGEEPKRDGYTFAGWQPSVAATVTGNTTYTAQWKADADHSDNPDTGDNLILSFILPLLSASSLTVLALVKRRKNG